MAHIGEPISLADGHRLTLVEIRRSNHAADAGSRAAFALILRGPRAPVATEGMHRLVFEDGSTFDLYLIPIHTAGRDHQDYQIVFKLIAIRPPAQLREGKTPKSAMQ